jgi:hypothetical protein
VTFAALLSAFLVGSPQPWTLDRARHVLAAKTYAVTDTSQPDRPQYELTFLRGAVLSLRRDFTFRGRAHDELTDTDVAVRFIFKRPGRIVAFRGPAADTSQPSFPIRAAFYYAWYPEAWFRFTVVPYSRYHPSLDYYGASDPTVITQQIDAMRYAQLDAGIYSWWGVDGYPPTDARFWRYLAAARTTPFRWAIYYEREGYEDPSVEHLRTELEYIRDAYASQPAYLKVDGRFVVFVYGDAGDSCATAERWRDANAAIGAYIVLKAFAGYRDCAAQPSAWHQYSGDQAEYGLLPDSYMISPGFEEVQEPQSRLSRELERWRQNVADMVASEARWQLVISFNEWPEGTSVESAREWATPSGYGAYVDALHALIVPKA